MTISREQTASREQAAVPSFQNWRTVLPLVVWSGLTVIAIVLISRKLSGAFAQDLSATGGCLGVTLVVWISFAAAVLYRTGRRSEESRLPTDRLGELALGESVLMGIVALTAPLLIGLALLPGDSLGALLYAAGLFLFLLTGVVLLATDSLAGLVLLAADSFSFRRQPAEMLSDESSSEAVSEIAWPSTDSPALTPDSLIDVLPGDALSFPDDEPEEESVLRDGESVSQQFTRTRTATGAERISGSLAVGFAAGQRQATVHFPFVPPLATLPSIDCHVPEGHAVRLKVAAVHCYGTRIELKRSAGSEMAETIEISFTATTAEAHPAAA